jgi:putative hemolysin
MSLIDDRDLRKILKIRENEGKWLLTSIKHFLRIEEINQIYNDNSSPSGPDFVDYVINKLNIKYSVYGELDEIIPREGPFIIIANHPFGGIEGLLLLKLICKI